jgi:hypothetical protein
LTSRYDHLADRVEAITADLDEMMFDSLRESAAARTGRPADDKRLMQARRALDKATHLLRGSDGDIGGADD